MSISIRPGMGRVVSALVLTAAAVLSSVAVTAAPAAAADTGVTASCARTYEDDLDLLPEKKDYFYGTPKASAHHTVDCSTISIRVLTSATVCAQYRVRFFPKAGGEIVNGWKPACSGQAINVAVNVKPDTAYRIESTHHRVVRVRD